MVVKRTQPIHPDGAGAGEAYRQRLDAHARAAGTLAEKLRRQLSTSLAEFPWTLIVRDWEGTSYTLGQGQEHWYGEPLVVTIKTRGAARDLLSLRALSFLDRFVRGEVDFDGNLYALSTIRDCAKPSLTFLQKLSIIAHHQAFQTSLRTGANVKSHYDVPQEALNVYLDRVFMSYSCGMFENPHCVDRVELLKVGQGETDTFDSLEKSQWRKFADAADFLEAEGNETLLDIGCGYGGQLLVGLQRARLRRVVGWTHSGNQVSEGRKLLAKYDPARWELNEGDYRGEPRVFDHVTSLGMISHVGPRGLVPYVKNVRARIRTGGRYVHDALMTRHNDFPLDFEVGVAFNKRYVWRGFHWFTLGTHIKALEENGFRVERATNLSQHYAKTTSAWYERMMSQKDTMISYLGDSSFRAWQIYLAGAVGGLQAGRLHDYRLYCVAV